MLNKRGLLRTHKVPVASVPGEEAAMRHYSAVRSAPLSLPNMSRLSEGGKYDILSSFVIASDDQAKIDAYHRGDKVALRFENDQTMAVLWKSNEASKVQFSHMVTSLEMRGIMPGASMANIDAYVGNLNDSMAIHGIVGVDRQSAFLANVAQETGQLGTLVEGTYYRTPAQIRSTFARMAGAPDAHLNTLTRNQDPQGFANEVYANINGNGPQSSGDGWRYRGRGFLQVTGRANYRARGYEANPELLANPAIAADSAGAHWEDAGLNGRTAAPLNDAQFRGVVRTVNGGLNGIDRRLFYYHNALRVIQPYRGPN